MNKPLSNRWWVVAASVCGLVVGTGPINTFAFGVFLKPVTQELGIGRGVLGSALAGGFILTTISTAILGWLLDHWGTPAFTDDPANVAGVARFVSTMKNVEWVEVQPFHQLGAFKWKAMHLDYKHNNTPTPEPGLIERVMEQFRAEGCNVR